jgi:glutathione S-transferase/RNA polymerase-associated protein
MGDRPTPAYFIEEIEMIVFYDAGLSPFAQKVKMGLIEKGLPFEHRFPDLAAPEQDFLAASPRREVPALVDEGVPIFDSTLILEYLEDKWPQPPLLPEAAADRARVRMVEELCDSQFEAIIFGMTEVIAFKRAEGQVGKAILEQGRRDIQVLLAWLGRQLGKRTWFNGESFGFGDISVLPYVHTANLYKLAPEPGSGLAAWFERARERPSFQRCLADAKAEVASFKAAAQKVMSGQWPRQYRDHRLDWFIRAGGADIVRSGLAAGTIRLSNLPA